MLGLPLRDGAGGQQHRRWLVRAANFFLCTRKKADEIADNCDLFDIVITQF